MKTKNYLKLTSALFILLTFGALARSQTPDFTYQGRLLDSSLAANGNYDFEFKLYDAQANGNLLGTIVRPGVVVSSGIFTVRLDFPVDVFDGTDRFLEIGVKPAGNPNTYVGLAPRQPITSAPYSVRSLNSATADIATNSNQLNGIPSSGFIHNGTSQQGGSDFNISGNGTLGGTLNADNVNSATQYSIGGNSVLSVPGQNTFVGLRAGVTTTTGLQNTFVGHSAGEFNTTGGGNTFVGDLAGNLNTTAGANSFFGSLAGLSNTTGEFNSFLGRRAGQSNSTGIDNTFLGAYAGLANTTGTSNTFIGANTALAHTTGGGNTYVGAFVGQNTTTANYNTFVGFNTGLSTTSGGANVFLGTFAGLKNTTGHENTFLGFNAGLNNIGGPNPNDGNFNTLVGTSAGSSNTTGGNNSFFGYQAGAANTTATGNTFVGYQSGKANTIGAANSFFGQLAGGSNLVGHDNTFMGDLAGASNFGGSFNAFFGSGAGKSNLDGAFNSFFGEGAGKNSTGANDTFIGRSAGAANSTGNDNVMVGVGTGDSITIENKNTLIGTGADGAAGVSNAAAIGNRAKVTQSNSLILGSINGINFATADTKVGIGTTAPNAPLHIAGSGTNVLLGSVTAGCAPGYAGIGFGPSLNCLNVSLVGNGTDTTINRPTGGSIYFMQNAVAEAGISPAGDFSVNNKILVGGLGAAGSTQLCRNALNQISTCSSSLRYKKDLLPFTPGLSLISQLHPITFKWKADNSPDLGFGAEDVAKAEPLLVTHNANGEVEGVKYDRISAVLVNAVKEQQAQIELLRKQVAQQQILIKGLKNSFVRQTRNQKPVNKRRTR